MLKKQILLVDDEPANIGFLFNELNNHNYELFVAKSGEACLNILETEEPSAIIIDWEMPGMTGIEVIRQIRANPTTNKIPIIMATGKMTSVENFETAFLAGANDYVRKPFNKTEIIARIKSLIKFREENDKVLQLEKEIFMLELEHIKSELEMNQKTLTSSTLKLIQSQENTKKIIEDLIQLKEVSSMDHKERINDIISSIKINIYSTNWKEFEIAFEKVHTNFYINLSSKFPNLTPNERKTCAFLKLNLSNKEICAITLSTESAIKKAKTRLRKKLNLEPSEDLKKFIQTI